jgi:phage terminase large subunit-like protein
MELARIDAGVEELNKKGRSPEEALAFLDQIEKNRREQAFLKYWVPFNYQKKVFEAFDKDTKILVVAGGNRSGKTEVGAALTIAFAEGKEWFKGEKAWEWVEGLPIPEKLAKNIWIVGLDFNVLRDVIWREKLMTGANHPGFCPKDETVVNVRTDDKQIFFKNNAVITGKSADSGREKFQSASVDLAWLDEECDAEIFDEVYQRTIDCNGRIIITVTPLTDIASAAKQPWLFDLYEEMKAGRKDIKFVHLSVLDNPIISQEEKDKLVRKWSGHVEEKARLYGEFVRRSGLVFPMWDRKKHFDNAKLVVPADWFRVVSIDPANTGTTAALWGAVDPNHNIHLYREYYEKDLVVSDHVRNIKVRNMGDKVDIWLIDPKWGSQRDGSQHKSGQQLYRDAGLPVRLAEVGEDYGLSAASEYLQATTDETSRQPKVWVKGTLVDFISEIEHYTWSFYERGPLKGLSKDKPVKRNDHLMDSFRYMAAMRPKGRMRRESMQTDEQRLQQAARNSYFS